MKLNFECFIWFHPHTHTHTHTHTHKTWCQKYYCNV